MRGPDSERMRAQNKTGRVTPWFPFRGTPRPQFMLLHTVLQEPLLQPKLMNAVAVPNRECAGPAAPLYPIALLPLLWGVRTYIVGFHSATTWGQGPHQNTRSPRVAALRA